MGAAQPLAGLALGLCLVLGASCLPDYGEAPFACTQSSACPEGYRCVDQVCRRGDSAPVDARRESNGRQPDVALDIPKLVDAHVDRDLGRKDSRPAGWTCAEIGACYNTCAPGHQPCLDACFSQGSPDGQAKMSALVGCQLTAAAGPCYDQCHNQTQPVCAACLQIVCAAQLAACYP